MIDICWNPTAAFRMLNEWGLSSELLHIAKQKFMFWWVLHPESSGLGSTWVAFGVCQAAAMEVPERVQVGDQILDLYHVAEECH